MPEVLTERDEHVVTLTLNRPDRMNSIGGNLLQELTRELHAANADPAVRAIVLTGAGRGFCSGLDLQDAASKDGDLSNDVQGAAVPETPPFVMRRIDKPILCAMNGPAAGYGMDLALGCDFLIVSDQATFVPPVRRGAVPESGGTWLLPRLIGWQKACEVTLLARKLDAKEIERLGLANRVVPHAQLMEETLRWAHEIAMNAPLAVQAAKRSMRAALDSSFETNSLHVLAEVLNLFHTQDFREGLAAFMEKREPKYIGR
jgi:enoyl-CoA hydratase/carnithine racemase